jgi:hypothetical protein
MSRSFTASVMEVVGRQGSAVGDGPLEKLYGYIWDSVTAKTTDYPLEIFNEKEMEQFEKNSGF